MPCLVVLLAGLAWGAEQGDAAETVVVTGESPHSFQEAQEDALRVAVERVAGRLVHASSRVHDFRLVHHTIVSRAAGYVRRFQVLERREQQGLFQVQVRAEVARGQIDADWAAVRTLIARKGRPAVLIVVEEQAAGVPQTDQVAEHTLREVFDRAGVDVVDDEALDALDDRDRLRAELAGDARRAAAVAARLRAAYLVAGRARVRGGAPETIYGVESTPIEAGANLKVVEAATGRQLASKTATVARSAIDPLTGARLAVAGAARQAGTQALRRTLEHWARDLDLGAPLTLVGTGVDTDVLDALLGRLRGLEGVESARVVDHNDQWTVVRVATRLGAASLSREIPRLSGGRLAVTGYSRGRVEFAPADGRAVPPAPAASGGPQASPAVDSPADGNVGERKEPAQGVRETEASAAGRPALPLVLGGASGLAGILALVGWQLARHRSR
ncbi:MAG: hypothetical protein ACLF0G_07700 [Candidatus Brocadiia bacterium]